MVKLFEPGFPDLILYLALISALAIGFWQGKRHNRKPPSEDARYSLSSQYVQGLNFLLNEEPDAAIEAFIKALEVNSETLETHLALGKLLRKRGEVDRATRIHQNLLARPGLSREQAQQVQYELATDFAKAGLLDRAEGLLQELVKDTGPFQVMGLQRLLEVYRDEKEWQQGLVVLQSLSGSRLSKTYEQWAPVRAHFCCELAEQAIARSDYPAARQWLKRALNYHKQSARALLLSGRLEIANGNLQRGIHQLQRIAVHNPDYLTEALPGLAEGYRQIDGLPKYRQLLLDMAQREPNPTIILALTDVIAQLEGEKAAVAFITKEVIRHPSGIGLHKLLDYYPAFTGERLREYLAAVRTIMEKIVTHSPHYRCSQCGFKAQKLHWLCPGCKSWGQIKPVKRVDEGFN